MNNLFLIFYFFIIGTIFGSCVIIYVVRSFKKENLLTRLHCCECGHSLKFIECIPIIGYIISRGRCRYCETKINIKYILAEILYGIIIAYFYWKYGFSLTFYLFFLMTFVFYVISLYDIFYTIIPFKWIIIGFIILLIYKLYVFFKTGDIGIITFSFKGFLLGYFILFPFALFNQIGGGDLKLLSLIGFWFGWKKLLIILYISCLLSLIYFFSKILLKKKLLKEEFKKAFSFGEFICLAVFVFDLIRDKIDFFI